MRSTRNCDNVRGGGRSTLKVHRAIERAGGRLVLMAGSKAATAIGATNDPCTVSTLESCVFDFWQPQPSSGP